MGFFGKFMKNRIGKKLGIKGISKKVDQIDKKVTGIAQKIGQSGTNQVNPADALTVQPTTAGPGIDSTEDVSQTMIDPTQVQEGMMGEQDEILDDSTSALVMLKNMVRKSPLKEHKSGHETPKWKKEHNEKFQAKKDAIAAEKARLLEITRKRREKTYGTDQSSWGK